VVAAYRPMRRQETDSSSGGDAVPLPEELVMYNQLENAEAVLVDSMPAIRSDQDLDRVRAVYADLQRQWYRDALNIPVGLGFGLVGVLGLLEHAAKAVRGLPVPIPLWIALLVFGLIGYVFSQAAFLNIRERLAYRRLLRHRDEFCVIEGRMEKFGIRLSRSNLYSQRITWSSDRGRGFSPHLSHEILSQIVVGSRVYVAVPARGAGGMVLLGVKPDASAARTFRRLSSCPLGTLRRGDGQSVCPLGHLSDGKPCQS